MKRGVIACAVLLCALPAQGDLTTISPAVLDALTQIDTAPSKTTLNSMFPTQDAALANLRMIALDHTNFGVQLRAIRALPAYCPTLPLTCNATVPHDTLLVLVDEYKRSQRSPQDILRARAAIEALGATHTSLPSDVSVLSPLLADPSRDLRATVAHALRNVCSAEAIEPLRARFQIEPIEQVRRVINAALRDLRQCP